MRSMRRFLAQAAEQRDILKSQLNSPLLFRYQVSASGGEAHKYRDVYMAAAYYQPSGWAVDIRCRFDFGWNVKNKVRPWRPLVPRLPSPRGLDAPAGRARRAHTPARACVGGLCLQARPPPLPGASLCSILFSLVHPGSTLMLVYILEYSAAAGDASGDGDQERSHHPRVRRRPGGRAARTGIPPGGPREAREQPRGSTEAGARRLRGRLQE